MSDIHCLEKKFKGLCINQFKELFSGQNRIIDYTLKSCGQVMSPRYDMFQVVDSCDSILYCFFIQPLIYSEYENAIKHFINCDTSPVFGLLEGAKEVSLTFYSFVDNVKRNFTFNECSDSTRSLLEHVEEFYKNAYGSDLIISIRNNIIAVSISIVKSNMNEVK